MANQSKILEVKDVTVSFDGFTVLNKLNFSMNYGELRFLIGPNGAGKTTLLDIMTSKTKADTGQVLFDGQLDVGRLSEYKIVQRGIGRKFQTPTIFSSLTVYENLEAAIGFRERTMRLFRRLSGTHRKRIDEILELVGLQDRAQMRAGLLSHGQKQWLEIGMLLTQEPKLLLLDEPVAGMTRRERNRTGTLVQRIAQQHSVLVVEHDMEFVRQFANKVTVLHTGQVLCEGSMDQVQNDPRVIEVYLGRGREKKRKTNLKTGSFNSKRPQRPRLLPQKQLAV